MNLRSALRRYGLGLYWAACALFTIHQGQYPGLMLHPEEWRYPSGAVAVVIVLLAVLVLGLHLILRPTTYDRSWGRLLGAIGYSAILVALSFLTVATDLPGYSYVPAQFALLTFVSVCVFAVGQLVGLLWRKWCHAA
jgi:hypothetical protein